MLAEALLGVEKTDRLVGCMACILLLLGHD
jgi:hypothetical protein